MKKHRFISTSMWLVILSIQGAVADVSEEVEVDTPNGAFTVTFTPVEPVPQRITVTSDEQRRAFRRQARLGPEFARHYVPDSPDSGLELYDQAFRAWQLAESPSHSSQHVVEVLGSILGNKLVDDLDMEWILLNDEYGTDFAVRSKRFEVMAFPFSTVVKRIENNEHDFMVGVYYAVKDRIESGEYAERSPKD